MDINCKLLTLAAATLGCVVPLQCSYAQQSAQLSPFVVNSQSYTAIDLSALSTNTNAVAWLALDDSDNAAFGVNRGRSSINQPTELDVFTFASGVVTPAPPLNLAKTDTPTGSGYEDDYTVASLLAEGKVFGYHHYYFIDTSPQEYSGTCYNGFSAIGDSCSDAAMPLLFVPYVKKPYTQLKCTASNGSYAGTGIYANTIFDGGSYNPGGDSGDPAAVDFIVHAGISDCFAPFASSSASNASTRVHTEQHLAISAINAKGWALGVGYDKNSAPVYYSQYADPSHSLGNQIWNADQQQFVNLDTPAVAINDDNDVLVSGTQDSTNHRYTGAFLLEKGDTGDQHYFLPTGSDPGLLPPLAQPHLRNIQPFQMSNRLQPPTDGSVQPALHILFTADIERDPGAWSPSAIFLLRLLSDGTTDLQEVTYPSTLSNVQIKSINSSGLIAALGNAGTGDAHALLLVPASLTVKKHGDSEPPYSGVIVRNGTTLDFLVDSAALKSLGVQNQQVQWYDRRIKQDGTFEDWTSLDASSAGFGYTYSPASGGIYQLKVVVHLSSTCSFDIQYTRTHDEPNATDRAGEYSDVCKKGTPNYFGVASTDAQLKAYQEAKQLLGSIRYAADPSLTVPVFGGGYFVGSFTMPKTYNKCNAFVYEACNEADVDVPLTNRNRLGFLASPPRAFDWYDSAYTIPGWTILSTDVYPEPGFVIARPDAATFGPPGNPLYHGRWGHVGILDFDGCWLQAGSITVNKFPHLTTQDYQPVRVRKYIGP